VYGNLRATKIVLLWCFQVVVFIPFHAPKSIKIMNSFFRKSVNLVPWWLRDHVRNIPLISSMQRLLMKYFLSGEEFSYKINAGPAKGLNFPITLPEDKLIWTGTWEKEVSEKIFFNTKKGMPSYDIGSHRGFMAGIMSLAGASKVYCFEPNPENKKHLKKLFKLNEEMKLELLPYAISDKNTQAEFSLMPESSMGKLSASSFQFDAERNTSITVEVRTLDELLEHGEIEAPGFIKIDVEGAELFVLKGAKKLIGQYFPSFVVELHSFSLAHDCQSYLLNKGYNVNIIQKEIDLSDDFGFKVCHLLAIYNR